MTWVRSMQQDLSRHRDMIGWWLSLKNECCCIEACQMLSVPAGTLQWRPAKRRSRRLIRQISLTSSGTQPREWLVRTAAVKPQKCQTSDSAHSFHPEDLCAYRIRLSPPCRITTTPLPLETPPSHLQPSNSPPRLQPMSCIPYKPLCLPPSKSVRT